MKKQFFKVLPLAGAIGTIMLSANVMAAEAVEETATASIIEEAVSNPTDILTDGWTVNGYIRTGWRINSDGVSTDSEFGKPDYNTAGTTGHNANQVEFVLGKMTEFQNGVWSELGFRAEYGNGESMFYSSPGSENHANITYNRDYYGFDGWTQSAIAYGTGMAANRGVNFGAWSGQKGGGAVDNKNARTVFATSYGVLNISDNWQMGSEITYLHGKSIWTLSDSAGGDTVNRLLVAARPT